MPSSSRNERAPGDKLLPKLIKAVTTSVIATKLGLAKHEFDLRVESGQELIDRMGLEAATLYKPMTDKLLSEFGEQMHPIMKRHFERIGSGDYQIEALLGSLQMQAASALSSVISNYLFPLTSVLNDAAPSLPVDMPTGAQAVTRGLADYDVGALNSRKWGYTNDAFDLTYNLSLNWPDVPTIQTWVRRGLIDQGTANTLYQRQATVPDYIDQYIDTQDEVLSPADAALAVLRGDITEAQGRKIANDNGITDANFTILLNNTGEPPGAQELMEAWRRGFIDEATFKTGILQSRIRDQWVPTLEKLRYSPLNTADAVDAYVEGYITEDDVKSIADQNGLEPDQYKILIEAAGDPLSPQDMLRLWRWGKATEDDVKAALRRGRLKDDYIDFAVQLKDMPMSVADAIEAAVQGYLTQAQAKDIASMNGLREQDFDPLYLTAGDPLPKEEMLQLWRRGKVTEDQVKAALRESRLKDSYIDTALDLKLQLPALYETRTLLSEGSLSAAEATKILLEQGYSSDIVKSIVAGATGANDAGTKALTQTIYLDLYQEGALTGQELQQELVTLGYTQADAELIQAAYDLKSTITARNQVIAKIKAAFVAGKINEATAQNDLNAIDIPSTAVDRLIADWSIIQSMNVKTLSAAQVVDAWQLKLFDTEDQVDNTQQALNYLMTLGYDGADAVKLLEIKNKGAIGDTPAPATGSTQASTGTTQATSGGT